MNIEQNRLTTFSPSIFNYPAEELAAAGFFATRNDSEIQCYWCLEKITQWETGTDPMRVHKSDCPFVLNPRTSGNIPIGSNIDFQDEAMRLETFQNWPLTFISATDLVKAGFYYIHRSDQVKCAWCQGVIGQWECGDDPLVEHLRFFPACPKARAMEFNETVDRIGPAITPKLPKAMQFVTLESRSGSYESWRLGDVQDPQRLAEAGFYYLGNDDEVRCFHCDGGLRSWLQEDDPWVEHARWFPKCSFLLLTKGHEFVRQIQEQNKTENRSAKNQSVTQQPTITFEDAMGGEPVQQCLQMGLHIGRIRSLVKRKLETTGTTYLTSQSLAEAVLDDQIENECDDDDRRPMRNTVTNLLWSAIQSTSAQPEPVTVQNVEVTPEKAKNEDVEHVAEKPAVKSDEPKDPKDLEEENKRLRDARECKICMNNEIGVVFIPCGHLVTCVQCAVTCMACPICRADIEGQVRTFLV